MCPYTIHQAFTVFGPLLVELQVSYITAQHLTLAIDINYVMIVHYTNVVLLCAILCSYFRDMNPRSWGTADSLQGDPSKTLVKSVYTKYTLLLF